MDRDRFRRLVQRAVRSLPPEIATRLDNVEVVIEREPSWYDLRESGMEHGGRLELFGLYIGVPLTERAGGDPSLPDRIVIYQRPLEGHFTARELTSEIQRTVAHELAHHFGIDDARLHRLGLG